MAATVIFTAYQLNTINKHIYAQPDMECGGYLFGNVIEQNGDTIIVVKEIYYNSKYQGQSASFDFSAEYGSESMRELRDYNYYNNTNAVVLGTYHSHGTMDAFHSGIDFNMGTSTAPTLMVVVSPRTRKIIARQYYEDGRNYEECKVMVTESIKTEEFQAHTVSRKCTDFVSGGVKHESVSFSNCAALPKKTKKVLIVGAGTLGNLMVQGLACAGMPLDITIADFDVYKPANAPRSPMIDLNESHLKEKSVELARMLAKSAKSPCVVTGLIDNIMDLGSGYLEQFDVIVSPVDNLEVRYYLSIMSYLLGKTYINLGTAYIGIGGQAAFSGEVFIQNSDDGVCLDCSGLAYKSNDKIIYKRTSCVDDGIDAEVQPQVVTSSSIVASVAVKQLVSALKGKRISRSTKYYVDDCVAGRGLTVDFRGVNRSPKCAFEFMHDRADKRIATVEIKRSETISELHSKLNAIINGGSYLVVKLVDSMLTNIAYRRGTLGFNIDVMQGDETVFHEHETHKIGRRLPSSHIYAVVDGEDESTKKYIKINILEDK